MNNCTAVLRNGEAVAWFRWEHDADMYVQLMKQAFGHLNLEWATEQQYRGCL